MHSLPLSIHFSEGATAIHVTVTDCEGDVISHMEFGHIDQAMFFISPFATDNVVIANPKDLRQLLKNSDVPYVFYEASGRINRRETIRKVIETTNFKTVAAIHRFTGFPTPRIHESISRFKHDHPAAT